MAGTTSIFSPLGTDSPRADQGRIRREGEGAGGGGKWCPVRLQGTHDRETWGLPKAGRRWQVRNVPSMWSTDERSANTNVRFPTLGIPSTNACEVVA